MGDVLIPREPIPVSLTAAQVVAYLLRTGWTECGPVSDGSRDFRSDRFDVWIRMLRGKPNKGLIVAIARAESRPALDVAADIAGPVVGTVGVGCAPRLTGAAWVAQSKCLIAGWPAEKQRTAWRNLGAFAAELDEAEAPIAPEEE